MLPFVLQREGLLFTRVIFLSFDSLVSCYSREVRCAVLPESLSPVPFIARVCPLESAVRCEHVMLMAMRGPGVLDTVECGAIPTRGLV